MASPVQAEVQVLKGDTTGKWSQRFDLSIGGSIRVDHREEMGSSDSGSYRSNVYADSTRFKINGEYLLGTDSALIGYYEPGVDFPHILRMHNHYNPDKKRIETRRLYFGIRDDDWGRLTYGKQDNAYYSTVEKKTGKWNNDKLAQASGVALDEDYDGVKKARRLLNYDTSFGALDLFVTAKLSTDRLSKSDMTFKRKGGAAVGIDYQLSDAVSFALGYNYTDAELKQDNSRKSLNQHSFGVSANYDDHGWYTALGTGLYKDYVPSIQTGAAIDNFFDNTAYGVSTILARTFKLDYSILESVQPYVAADRMQVTSGKHYQRTNEFVGVYLYFLPDLRLEFERTFTQSTDNIPDQNRIRLRWDF